MIHDNNHSLDNLTDVSGSDISDLSEKSISNNESNNIEVVNKKRNYYNNSAVYTNFHSNMKSTIISQLSTVSPEFRMISNNNKNIFDITSSEMDRLIKELYVKLTNTDENNIIYKECYLFDNLLNGLNKNMAYSVGLHITQLIIGLSRHDKLQPLYNDILIYLLNYVKEINMELDVLNI